MRTDDLRGWYDLCTDLQPEDYDHLERILKALPLLADITHADLLVCARAGQDAAVVSHAAPNPVPSLYPRLQTGEIIQRRERNGLFRVLHDGKEHAFMSGMLVWGAPTVQEVFPIRDPEGRLIAIVAGDSNLLEHERFNRREPLFRTTVARVRDQGFAGRLEGAEKLGRLTEHDGVLIVDKWGIIRYMNSVAENQYRRVGYVDSLLGEQISELDTNEYICFRSMERGICLEQRITEQDQVWIKRAIPLFPVPQSGFLGRSKRVGPLPDGAAILIQDITDEVRREQEIKTKSAMIQEVHHRVKNNLQTVAFLLRMEARRAKSTEVQETLRQTMGRILSIAVVHEFLSRGDGAEINIRDVCSRIVAETSASLAADEKAIEITLDGGTFALPAQQATSCALVVNELLSNAIEHAFPERDEGRIDVRLEETDASMVIRIADNGVGLPEGFDPTRTPNLGLQIVQTLVKDDLKGQLLMASSGGAVASISVPKELCLRTV